MAIKKRKPKAKSKGMSHVLYFEAKTDKPRFKRAAKVDGSKGKLSPWAYKLMRDRADSLEFEGKI